MVSQISREIIVKNNFDYIKDVYEVCLNRYLQNHKNINNALNSIDNGRKIISSEEEIDTYIAFYGAQHYYKLVEAFDALNISNFCNQQLDILSYGCGAATDTCSLISYCQAKKINFTFRYLNLTLIEPSQVALQRGINYIEQALSHQELKTINIKQVNKYLDELKDSDIGHGSKKLKLHVFSNILDLDKINLDKLANLITMNCHGTNYFICISPKKYDGKERIDYFYNKISAQTNCSTIDMNKQNFSQKIWLMKQNNYVDNFYIDRYHRIFKTE